MRRQDTKMADYRALTGVLSVVAVFVLFAWQGDKGFNLWDEGYLWYGTQRVMLGEVPIRDFMSYDPGRYYWSAALMGIISNDGIMGQRFAIAVFQAAGLFAGLLLIAQTAKRYGKESFAYLLLSAATLLVWMFPRHKLFDISLSIFLIAILTFLVRSPTGRRHFISGVCIGLIAVFGRNHGIYGVVAGLGVLIWLNIGRPDGPGFLKGCALWGGGVIVGFSPILAMAYLVPGFASAFLESVRFLFDHGATNISLPVPWPWKVKFGVLSFTDAARGALVGIFFIGIIAFGVLSVPWVVAQKLNGKLASPALVAAAFLSLPYAHFAYSRADVGHLAQGVFPLLVGCFMLLSNREGSVKWPLAFSLCAASFWLMHVFHPGWQCLDDEQCVSVEVSSSELQVDPGTANDIALLRMLADQYARNGQSFIATPFWPGAYALLERKSPLWEIYALFPRAAEFEQSEIQRIEAEDPGFAVVVDLPLDGRDELRYRNTHPLTYQYILDNFERLPDSSNPAYQIYKSRRLRQ